MKSLFSAKTSSLAVAKIINEFASDGIKIDVNHDIQKFYKALKKIDNRKISEQFSNAFFDFTPTNSFWVAAYSEDKLVSTQAIRLDQFGEMTLAEYWQKQQPRIYGGVLGKDHAPGADHIKGNVCYHGEMWMHKDFRSASMGPRLAQLGQMLAFVQWRPDFIYLFTNRKLAEKGFPISSGFVHTEPVGTDWVKPPKGLDPGDYIAWNSFSDMARIAQLISNGNL